MSSDLQASPDRAWWTATDSTPLRTRVMAGSVATCLLAVCAVIWMSPGGVIDQVQEQVTGIAAPDATELALRAQLAEAQDQIAEMEEQVAAAAAPPASPTGTATPTPVGAGTGAAATSAPVASSTGAPARPTTSRPATVVDGPPATGGRPTLVAPEPAHCEDFGWQQDAQVALVADLQDPGGLDNNRDGIACGQLPTDPARPASRPSTVVPLPTAPSKASLVADQAGTDWFGLYTQQAPFDWSEFDATAGALGQDPSVVGYFGGWDQQFRPDVVISSWQRGVLPMLTWESRPILAPNDVVDEPEYSLSTIIDGSHDAYITAYAEGIAALGLPIAIRFDHEMNSAWYPWSERDSQGRSVNGNRSGQYVAAWQHVHDLFEAAGAGDEVIWTWAPNIVNNLTPAQQGLDGYYPGDAYVDWVGLSGYYRPPYAADNDATFGYTFDRSLAELSRVAPGKPVFLAEVGASATLNGDKNGWVTSFFAGVARHPEVIGFAWFNNVVTTTITTTDAQGKTQKVVVTNDWRLNSRADATAASTAGLASLVVRRPV